MNAQYCFHAHVHTVSAMSSHVPQGLSRAQQGAALVVSLIILVIMTLLGVTAIQVTTSEEKMVANLREFNIAFQAAEAALNRGEEVAKNLVKPNPSNNCANQGLCNPVCSSALGNIPQCQGKLDDPPIWESIDWGLNKADGSYTGPALIYGAEKFKDEDFKSKSRVTIASFPTDSVARQPRYIIEDISPGNLPSATIYDGLYRITAQGYGQTLDSSGQPIARVTLQSIYKK